MSRILLVDKQPVVILGIESVIIKVLPQYEISFAKTIHDVEEMLVTEDYQLLVIGPNIDIYQDIEFILKILKHHVNLFAVFFIDDIANLPLKRLHEAGLKGVIEKNASFQSIYQGLSTIAENNLHFYISDKLKIQMIDLILDIKCNKPNKLTAKEKAVAKMLTEGKNNKQIGALLSIKPTTVSTFKTKIFTKLKVDNVVQLVRAYKEK